MTIHHHHHHDQSCACTIILNSQEIIYFFWKIWNDDFACLSNYMCTYESYIMHNQHQQWIHANMTSDISNCDGLFNGDVICSFIVQRILSLSKILYFVHCQASTFRINIDRSILWDLVILSEYIHVPFHILPYMVYDKWN